MKKGKIIIAILLAFVILAGAAGIAYYCCYRNTDTPVEDETPVTDNTEIVEALQRIIALLESGIENQASVNENITAQFADLSARIEDEKADIDGIILELHDVFTALFLLGDEIDALEPYDDTAIYGLYDSVIGSLTGLIQGNDILAISHADLLNLFNGLQAVVNGLVIDVENMDFDLGSVKTDLQAIAHDVNDLLDGYAEISSSLDNALTLISNLTIDFDIFRTDITTINNAIAEIQNALSMLGSCDCAGMLSALQSDIGDIQYRVTQNEGVIAALQISVAAILGDNSAMDGRVSGIESVLSALESTVSYLSTELSYLQSQMCACPDYYWDFYYLNQRVEAIENMLAMLPDYSTLDWRITNLENEIAGLHGQLWDLENRIADLEAHKPIELLNGYYLTYDPQDPQGCYIYIPYEIVWQLSDKDCFRITCAAVIEDGILGSGGIAITRVIEFSLHGFGQYPNLAAIDTVSYLGIEILIVAMYGYDNGNYILQFTGDTSIPELWDIAEFRILSVEYIKGVTI